MDITDFTPPPERDGSVEQLPSDDDRGRSASPVRHCSESPQRRTPDAEAVAERSPPQDRDRVDRRSYRRGKYRRNGRGRNQRYRNNFRGRHQNPPPGMYGRQREDYSHNTFFQPFFYEDFTGGYQDYWPNDTTQYDGRQLYSSYPDPVDFPHNGAYNQQFFHGRVPQHYRPYYRPRFAPRHLRDPMDGGER